MAPKPQPTRATKPAQPARPPVKRSDAHPLDLAPARPQQEQPLATAPPAQASAVTGTGAPATPPTEDEIKSTPASERRQFNIGVPKALKLHRRAGLYAEDHGLSRQDQVALALDAWLRERGY